MKDTEVRIGNLVYGVYENESGEIKRNICRIMAVDETSSLGEGWNFLLERVQGEPTEYYDDTEPVPLSEEWLVKAGFEWDIYYQKHTDGRLCIQWVNEVCLVSWCKAHREDVLRYQYPKYVHQLQNLYFALTGEELEFKL